MGLGDTNNFQPGQPFAGAGGTFQGPSAEALADLHSTLDELDADLRQLHGTTIEVAKATAVVRSGNEALSKFVDLVGQILPMVTRFLSPGGGPAGIPKLSEVTGGLSQLSDLAAKAQGIGKLLALLPK